MLAPKAWRAVSTACLLVAVLAFIVGEGDIGLIALLASGVTFLVELVLLARVRRAGGEGGAA